MPGLQLTLLTFIMALEALGKGACLPRRRLGRRLGRRRRPELVVKEGLQRSGNTRFHLRRERRESVAVIAVGCCASIAHHSARDAGGVLRGAIGGGSVDPGRVLRDAIARRRRWQLAAWRENRRAVAPCLARALPRGGGGGRGGGRQRSSRPHGDLGAGGQLLKEVRERVTAEYLVQVAVPVARVRILAQLGRLRRRQRQRVLLGHLAEEVVHVARRQPAIPMRIGRVVRLGERHQIVGGALCGEASKSPRTAAGRRLTACREPAARVGEASASRRQHERWHRRTHPARRGAGRQVNLKATAAAAG